VITEEERNECTNLFNWVEDNDAMVYKIDRMLEWLNDSRYLNKEGKGFVKKFWDYTWHEGKHPDVGKANNE